MKRPIYLLMLLVCAVFVMNSCDDGNADTEVIDSAPAIKIVSPGNFVLEGSFQLTVEFSDGFVEELSRSPLASASYTITQNDSATLVPNGSGTFTVSGIFTKVDQAFANTLSPGKYFFNVQATDSKGNVSKKHIKFEIIKDFDFIGLVGNSTPGGWDNDTRMTRDAANPALWVINSIVLTNGFAKFRANGNWTVNWGATGFPSGTGTQGGPDIPITAGTYKVSINITDGKYSFSPL